MPRKARNRAGVVVNADIHEGVFVTHIDAFDEVFPQLRKLEAVSEMLTAGAGEIDPRVLRGVASILDDARRAIEAVIGKLIRRTRGKKPLRRG